MVFIVVQWLNENSVSVVNEKKVVGEDFELKEGLTVDISTGTSKGRLTIHKAEILKVFGTKAKALEYEASLVKTTSQTTNPNGKDTTGKRQRKPSKKVMENEGEHEDASEEQQGDKVPTDDAKGGRDDQQPPSKKKKTKDKKVKETDEEKENELQRKKLQQSVQQDRVKNILQIRSTEPVIIPDDGTNNTSAQSLSQSLVHATHTITSISHTVTPSQPPLISAPKPSPIAHTHATNPHTITPSQTLPSTLKSTATPTAYRHGITPLNTQPTTPIQSTFNKPPPFNMPSLSQTHYTNTPLSHRHQMNTTSFTSLLEEDLDLEYLDRTPSPSREVRSEWDSFTSHFTQQFEELKAEVEGLRAEVKHLKKTVRELKGSQHNSSPQAAGALNSEEPETTHLAMIKNTTKPLEGLKVLLYQLFTTDEVRQSSLKGRVTASGGEGVALDREKVDLIYCVMEKRYNSKREEVDNFIRGQQRKLRGQFQKKQSLS